MKALEALLRSEPVAAQSLVSALLALGVSFGLRLTADQTAAVVALAVILLSLVARSQVTPNVPPAPTPGEQGQVSLRLLFAVAGIIAGVYVLINAHNDRTFVGAGIGLILVAVGLVAP